MSAKEIIVGVDFSESSKMALKEAAHIAAHHKTWLNVIHVVDLEMFEREVDEKYLTVDLIKEKAFDALSKFALESMEYHPSLRLHVLVGHPFQEFMDMVEKLDTEFIVLGSYGNSGKANRAGTFATRLARYAKVPVLLVREGQKIPYETIVACSDFSKASKEVIDTAARMALDHKACLHLLNVHVPSHSVTVGPYAGLPALSSDFNMKCMEMLKKSLTEEASCLEEKYPDLEIKVNVVEAGGAASGIFDYLKASEANLAVLGTHGRNGLKTWLLGTTVERVIHRCPCSVLAIKAG